MSVKQMTMVWDLDIQPSEKIVLLAYADHADDDGEHVYPSLGRIAHKTCYSEDQVRRISRKLVEAGLMELVKKGHGRGKPHRYRLTLQKGSNLPAFQPKQKGGTQSREKVASGSEKGGIAVPPEPSSPESSVTPTGGTQSVDPEGENQEHRKPQQHLTDKLYHALHEYYGIRLSKEQYGFQLGYFAKIIEKENVTEAECERVIAHMVTVWPKAPKLEAARALQDVRLGRDDGSAFEKPQEQGFYERQQHNADKPRKPQWYTAFYGGSPDYYQSLIDDGYGHDDILEAVVSSEAVNVAV